LNYSEENQRISKLDIGDVKIELANIKKELKQYPAGGISSLNVKIVMLNARLKKLNERL